MAIFLDTCFLMGLSHPNDKYYSDSLRILQEMSIGKYGLVYTSPFVISESATLLLLRSHNNQLLLKNFHSYFYGANKFIRILSWTSRIEELTWVKFFEINKNLKDKKDWLSFVDISNIVYCQQHQIQNIASYDNHFDAFLVRIY